MMNSNQQIASVASIKHQMVNEISCDASPDIIPREGNKGKRHGMMHTHPHCKQQEMKVVDDEVSMGSDWAKGNAKTKSMKVEGRYL
jgi:hypothetical protein